MFMLKRWDVSRFPEMLLTALLYSALLCFLCGLQGPQGLSVLWSSGRNKAGITVHLGQLDILHIIP